MHREVRITVGATGTLLILAGLLVLILPGVNVVPWALLFFAVGFGLGIGAVVSQNADIARELQERQERQAQS